MLFTLSKHSGVPASTLGWSLLEQMICQVEKHGYNRRERMRECLRGNLKIV